MGYQPTMPTAFEQQIRKHGLDPRTCVTSKELRQWCERNRNRRYVPEWLLERWGISVDPNVSIERRPFVA